MTRFPDMEFRKSEVDSIMRLVSHWVLRFSPGYLDESDILGYCPQLLVKKEVRIIDISTGGGSGLYAGPLSHRRWI